MRNLQDSFETCERSFISGFSIFMTLTLIKVVEIDEKYNEFSVQWSEWFTCSFLRLLVVLLTFSDANKWMSYVCN